MVATTCSGCAIGFAGSPLQVSVDGAVFSGKVVSNVGGDTDYWLRYGTTPALGSETPRDSVTTKVNTPSQVIVELSGLQRDTVYHYRLCAEDSDSGACGPPGRLRTQDVACGETVTQSVRLTGTLVCGLGGAGPIVGPHGLVVGANGLEINLAGHSLTGPVFLGGSDVNGIDNTAGFDDVTIRNGVLGNWGQGIELAGADRNEVRDIQAQGSPAGIEVTGGVGLEVRRSDLSGRSSGLQVTGHDGLVVADSEIMGGFGPTLFIQADGSAIVRNELSAGIPTTALQLAGANNRVVGNLVSGTFGTGIFIGSGAGNVVAENEAFGAILIDPSSPAGQGGDGIFVASAAIDTRLRDNFAHDNDGDGIEVQSADTELRDNRADHNGDLGIQAVAGVTDLGGNSAFGNGNAFQCTGVFCQ